MNSKRTAQETLQDGMNATDNVKVKALLAGVYRQWRNDYLSVDKFAEHNEISIELADLLISEGRRFSNEQNHNQFNKGLALKVAGKINERK